MSQNVVKSGSLFECYTAVKCVFTFKLAKTMEAGAVYFYIDYNSPAYKTLVVQTSTDGSKWTQVLATAVHHDLLPANFPARSLLYLRLEITKSKADDSF